MKKELQDRTINELRAEARNKGIPFGRSMKKQDILDARRKKKARTTSGKTIVSPAKPVAGPKRKKPAAGKAIKEPSSVNKTEAEAKKRSRRKTATGLLKKKKVMEKTVNKAPAAATRRQEAEQPPLEFSTKKDLSLRLPKEYGENDFFLIVVDPDVIFASWEIKRKDLQGRHPLAMRLYDVTASGPAGRPEKVIEIAVTGRVGSGFFAVRMHGRDVMAEIGQRRAGRFRPILSSNMVSFPLPLHYYESGMPGEPEAGPPVGY
jgi:hypothetical protein